MGRLNIEDWKVSYFLTGLMLAVGLMALIGGNWAQAAGCFCATLGWGSAAVAEEKLSKISDKAKPLTSNDALNLCAKSTASKALVRSRRPSRRLAIESVCPYYHIGRPKSTLTL